MGEEQGANGAESIRHSKLASLSDGELKLKVGVLSLVSAGTVPSIAVEGGVVSTVKARVAGVWSALPTASTARTAKLCGPSPRLALVCGELHGLQPSPSSRHSNEAAPGPLKAKLGVVSLTRPLGPESIDVSGAVVSIVKLTAAGVGSVLAAASVARTRKLWAPSGSVGAV